MTFNLHTYGLLTYKDLQMQMRLQTSVITEHKNPLKNYYNKYKYYS